MKELKLTKDVVTRLQDEDMAYLVGAAAADTIGGSNTTASSGKFADEPTDSIPAPRPVASSCCQKSCK